MSLIALTRTFDIGFGAFIVLFVVLAVFIIRFVRKVGRRN